MSTSAQHPTPATDTRPGEVRTYRGRTVEELIPRIRAELGPGAMILRERQGLTGGVGGFFAKRCVEIDAQAAPRLSVYADDDFERQADPAAQFPGGAVSSPAAPAMPTTLMPETAAPQAPTLEAAMPTTPLPDATAPQAPTPEATMPNTTTPEAMTPDTTTPSTTTPDATTPDAAMGTAQMPETATPATAVESEAPTSSVAIAPEPAVPSAGRPHASRPGVAAPSARTTPDPFAALLARWEQVAANNAFDPDATPDPFGSVSSRAAVETPAPAPAAPEAPQAPTAQTPVTEAIPPATSLATQTAEAAATPAPEQASPAQPVMETQPIAETQPAMQTQPTAETQAVPEAAQTAAPQPMAEAPQAIQPEPASEPQPSAAMTPNNGFIAFDELGSEIDVPAAEATDGGETDPVSMPQAEAPTEMATSPVFRSMPMQSEPAEDPTMIEPAEAAVETSPVTPAEITAPEATVAPDETTTAEATTALDETETPEAIIAPEETETPEATATPESDHAAEAIGQTRLRNRLMDHGLSAPLAERLVADAAEAAGSPSEPMLVANAQAALTAMLPKPEEMPVDGGVIAIVGPSGSGKTRVVAALAAAYGRQGCGVTVARLRGTQRDDELAELLEGEEVDLIPSMTIRATVREVEAARGDLVILDTPATRVGDAWGLESLAETLARFLPDGVLLCTPATFTQKALAKLVEHHQPLQVDGLVATHYDQAGMLGTVVELAIESRIPLGHVHSGLDVADAISAVDPHGLAGDLVR